MRQRLERVVQVDARQRLVQLAVLLAHALAVDDEQRRAELGHQPPDLRRGERIDVSRACARALRVLVSNAVLLPEKGRIVGKPACRCHDRFTVPDAGRFAKVRRP